ncbi:Demethylmenaquinone methyltransferase, partial [Mycobacterium ahvazicum]
VNREAHLRSATRTHYEAVPFFCGGDKRVQNCRSRSFRFFPEEALDGLRVLDIGASYGEVALALRDRGAEPVCVDLTYRAAAYARKFNRINAIQADALRLPFADSCFDITIAVGVLHHTADHLVGLKEMARVTRPGGRALIFLYSAFTPYHGLYRLSHPLRRVTSVSSVSRIPPWVLGLVRPPTEFVVGQRLNAEQIKSLVADQFWTPHATFHTKRAIVRDAQNLGLRLCLTRPSYCYGRWFLFRRDSTVSRGTPASDECGDVDSCR